MIQLKGTYTKWADGGTGRRARLKILFQQWSEGSIPSSPTKILLLSRFPHRRKFFITERSSA